MKKVRRYITREQFDDVANAEYKSAWTIDNVVEQWEYCGYGYYGFQGYGIETSPEGDEKYYVEYLLGDSCD